MMRLAVGIAMLMNCAVAADERPEGDAKRRERMVRDQIEARGVRDGRVLAAMRRVERHRFVPARLLAQAYDDNPLPIGQDQTISQPYIVAAMTEAALLRGGERVLEIGTGSGYQAAVLATIVAQVYTIELLPGLGRAAQERLASLGYKNVHVRIGDGYQGWPKEAPFNAIVVTAAPEQVPQALLGQLKLGGRLVLPVGPQHAQELIRITRTSDGPSREKLMDVRFVPMVKGK